jgi:hypothetical protein
MKINAPYNLYTNQKNFLNMHDFTTYGYGCGSPIEVTSGQLID